MSWLAARRFASGFTPEGIRRHDCSLTLALLLCVASAVFTLSASAQAAELRIAVAANFAGTLQKLADQYRQSHGTILRLSSGSSGKLYAQIINGAPYDIFLSADSERPGALIDLAVADMNSLFSYAQGTLALWNPNANPAVAQGQTIHFAHIKYLALANPRHAPYGRASRQVLEALGQWQTLRSENRLALAENITQAWQYGASGNVDLAFVALPQLVQNQIDPTTYWLPPAQLYSPIIQQGVILTKTGDEAAARHFRHWLISNADAAATIRAAGYQLPSPSLSP